MSLSELRETIIGMISRILNGPNSGYAVLVVGGLSLALYACFTDYFVDESESSPMSEEDKERYALKATKVTRPIMIVIFLPVAGFGMWKMFQP